jgi:hypothetical protein
MSRVAIAVACTLTLAAMSARSDAAGDFEPTPLPKVTVTGSHDADGYLADHSRTATKTDSEGPRRTAEAYLMVYLLNQQDDGAT